MKISPASAIRLLGLFLLCCAIAACGGGTNHANGKICMLTLYGLPDQQPFSAIAWQAVSSIADELGWDTSLRDAGEAGNIPAYIDQMISTNCDLLIGTGSDFSTAIVQAAQEHPQQKFLLLDQALDPAQPNIWSDGYDISEASFLAGYLAAGMSRTGVVATFGGIKITPVTDFMFGFQAGVEYYNRSKGTAVRTLGYDYRSDSGVFIASFTSTEAAYQATQEFIAQGADIVLPVAGNAFAGAAQAAKENSGVLVIGVDVDAVLFYEEYADIILTSIIKRLDTSVLEAARAAAQGTFSGQSRIGDLASGHVGLAPFHAFENEVPEALKNELRSVQASIIANNYGE